MPQEKTLVQLKALAKERGLKGLNRAMIEVVEHGNESLVKTIIDLGATNLNESLETAAYYGHKNIVELLIEHGADDLIRPLVSASLYTTANVCSDDHGDIVDLLIDLITDSRAWHEQDFIRAATFGYETPFRENLPGQDVDTLNFALLMATHFGREYIVDVLLYNGATNFDEAMRVAIKYGHENIVYLLREHMNSH